MCVCVCVCVCVCSFCMVTDFSAKDKASGVKFCTAVHRRPRHGISHFCELCSPGTQNWTNRPVRQCRLWNRAVCGCTIGMCGYTSVPEDGCTCQVLIWWRVCDYTCKQGPLSLYVIIWLSWPTDGTRPGRPWNKWLSQLRDDSIWPIRLLEASCMPQTLVQQRNRPRQLSDCDDDNDEVLALVLNKHTLTRCVA